MEYREEVVALLGDIRRRLDQVEALAGLPVGQCYAHRLPCILGEHTGPHKAEDGSTWVDED